MKKSEMKVRLTEQLQGVRFAGALAESQLTLMEEAGITWDPEEPGWPELEMVRTNGGTAILDAVGPGMSDADAERIARAWNARRPGGEMEARLLDVVRRLADRFGHAADDTLAAMEGALHLGVDD